MRISVKKTLLQLISIIVIVNFAGVGSAAVIDLTDDIQMNIDGKFEGMVYFDAVDNNFYEDTLVTDGRLLLNGDVFIESLDTYVKIGAQFRHEIFNGFNNESDPDVSMREAYVELRKEKYNFAVGRQIVTWGKLDDSVIVDRINPQDYSHYILYDKQERKDPALMMLYKYFNDDVSMEVAYLPFFEPSHVKMFGSDWAMFGHLLEAVNYGTYTSAQKSAVNSIAISDHDTVTDKSLKNSQVGVRFRGKVNDVDYSLYYMNVYNSVPVLKEKTANGTIVKRFLYAPTDANLSSLVSSNLSAYDYVLEKVHPRVNVIGADYETVIGEYGFRGEMAFLMGMPFTRQNFSYVEKDMISVGIGVDHTTASNIYFDLQLVQDYILNYESLFAQERSPLSVTGTISKDFLRGKLGLELDWAFNISYSDWMINPQVSYEVASGVDVKVGSFIFEDGDEPSTLFGKFDENDVIYVKTGLSF
ncbi:MAG: hypothetical protein KKF78_02420 [Candidatus Omnitrophica bacterium]|nr:hypothetical protein [Candidatus Omnitrophota bacterium]